MLKDMFLEGAHWGFAIEVFGRSAFMFLFILIVLRLSGRRGVRQLTLFEVAIILSLGSAAGDPMFQDEIPIVYALVVFFTVIVLYKLVTWAASRSMFVYKLMEGKTMVIVQDGMFSLKHERDNDFSKIEFFSELRNQSVEHLGQIHMALLEVDGSVSVLFYPEKEIRYGLPLFPNHYKQVDIAHVTDPLACMYCGNVERTVHVVHPECKRCGRYKWAIAMNTARA